MAEIERAAERAVVELQGLLCEVRQIDLKLEEVRLMQRGESRDKAMQRLVTLKRMLIALATDAEEAIISHTRYTRKTFFPKHIVRGDRVARFTDALSAKRSHRLRVNAVARLSLIVLAAAALAATATGGGIELPHAPDDLIRWWRAADARATPTGTALGREVVQPALALRHLVRRRRAADTHAASPVRCSLDDATSGTARDRRGG